MFTETHASGIGKQLDELKKCNDVEKSKMEFKDISLDDYESAESLHDLGLDQLKYALKGNICMSMHVFISFNKCAFCRLRKSGMFLYIGQHLYNSFQY